MFLNLADPETDENVLTDPLTKDLNDLAYDGLEDWIYMP